MSKSTLSKSNYWVAYKTIVWKEIHRFLRIWPQTILPPAVTMSLYFLIFGNLIGSRIGEMGGFSYMEYIAPGIIMMSVITSSYSNVVSSFFSSKFQKHIEEMLVAPIPNYVILAGYITGGVARGLLVGLVVTCVALFFTDLKIYSMTVTLITVVCTSILFSLGGLINGAFAKSFDDVSIVPVFILTPLTYLGGVFYSINLLPEFWEKVSLFNPILYMVNAFRFGILGESDINIGVAFAVTASFIVALVWLALWVLNKGAGIKT
jgi:ABC-2 type transport system permease protein